MEPSPSPSPITYKTHKEQVADLIDRVEQALHTSVMLTGSRFFGVADETSDYDYFVQIPIGLEHIDYMRDVLQSLGFEEAFASVYADDNTFGVMYHANLNVHIQLTHNVSLKNRLQLELHSLRNKSLISALGRNKKAWRQMWGVLYEAHKIRM